MSRAKNFAAVAVLLFAFSITSYGGDQQTPGYVPPPPSTNTSIKSDTSEPTKDSTTNTDTSSTLGKETIDLCVEVLTTLLSVF